MELNAYGFFESYGSAPDESTAELVKVVIPKKLAPEDVIHLDMPLARSIVGYDLGGMARVRWAVQKLRAEFAKRGKPVKTVIPGLYGKDAGVIVFATVPVLGGTSDAWRVKRVVG